jgi:hypothetical protein
MAGKAPVLASRQLHFAMDKLSKNFLIDLVVDRVRAEIGENADDETIARTVQAWIRPVGRMREQGTPDLLDEMARLEINDQHYRNKTGPYRQASPPA